MSKRKWLLALLTFALIISASIQPAIAYFTSFVRAVGGFEVTVGDTTTIEEQYSDWKKEITIRNKDGSAPVFIRAKVIYTGLDEKEGFEVSFEDGENAGWSDGGDGYYYYGTSSSAKGLTPLKGGESTKTLTVEITNIPEKPTEGDSFSVTVIYESTPVRYDEAGNVTVNWDAQIIEVGSTTGGNS